ncbi:hypothetical protein CROQUDRAFT_97405 [Cronartium quercuum f. sp. fusiforme G11]|uniref:Uncharacterized protein n=1 Tax=Cronartium quercuum f. sp. fusiforme G11 TaxID=708437 RepID=A0A9P6T8G2_9BASI|nr:hypothetical protein CROQUDRAFT_97405 [Cronartium quercuum f. sp. fusiforme G11]
MPYTTGQSPREPQVAKNSPTGSRGIHMSLGLSLCRAMTKMGFIYSTSHAVALWVSQKFSASPYDDLEMRRVRATCRRLKVHYMSVPQRVVMVTSTLASSDCEVA